jgi:hypothetical protein
MKTGLIVLGALVAALAGPGASAQQVLNLSARLDRLAGSHLEPKLERGRGLFAGWDGYSVRPR